VSAFSDQVATFLDEYFRLEPVHATAAGVHVHDASWPDLTEAGRRERLAFVDRWERLFGDLDDADLTLDDLIDRDLLIGQLDAIRFDAEDLREECWDALSWVYLLGDGLFPLLAREFAPLDRRLESAAGRLDRLPAVVEAARGLLVGVGGRPVSRLHVETAITRLPGIVELVNDAVEAGEAGQADAPIAELLPRLRAAADAARSALSALEHHLREVVLPRSDGEGRLGPELFAAKLRRTLQDDELTPARILAAAEREYAAVRAEMIRIATEIWPRWRPDAPLPSGRPGEPGDESGEEAAAAIVRGVLDAVAAEHPSAPEVLDFCRAELRRVEAFCRERALIGLADEPLEIRWTPAFLRSSGGAMLHSPGPLDRGQKAFFSVTPIPDDWPAEQAESYLREDNDRMLRLLTIHEAVPGHYLQGAYANRCPSITRAVFSSGVFAEGWAVYVTQVMMDTGYGADDPALLLTHWKFYLRSITNAIIDVKIHTMGMTEDEAVSLMVDGGFQEEAEARAKYDRARLSSTQLSTYFVGSLEFWDLERERRVRLAEASGDPRGAAAVPTPRIVGGFGETPGFVYRDHLEACISHGSPPIPLLRRILLA
jgi:uncharacterized protein (DUF885 family)